MNIPDGRPTAEMLAVGVREVEKRFYMTETSEDVSAIFLAMLAAAPTPSEVEPLAERNWFDGTEDADGNPLPTDEEILAFIGEEFGSDGVAIQTFRMIQEYLIERRIPPAPEVVDHPLTSNPVEYQNPENVNDNPPEVEPVAWKYESFDGDCWYLPQPPLPDNNLKVTPLYTHPSPQSPKAEYSATGEPLNLRAAARDAAKMLSEYEQIVPDVSELGKKTIANLRKFLGESC